jgi:hypothetical protein
MGFQGWPEAAPTLRFLGFVWGGGELLTVVKFAEVAWTPLVFSVILPAHILSSREDETVEVDQAVPRRGPDGNSNERVGRPSGQCV